MNDLTAHGDRRMTLKQIAAITGASYSTVAAYAQKAGWTENGKLTLLDEAQVTVILEAMKKPVSSGSKSNLTFQMEGIETEQTLDFQLACIEKQAHELWKRKAVQEEARAVKAEQKLRTTRQLLDRRTDGLEMIQRIAEAGGLMLTDQDDLYSAYRGWA